MTVPVGMTVLGRFRLAGGPLSVKALSGLTRRILAHFRITSREKCVSKKIFKNYDIKKVYAACFSITLETPCASELAIAFLKREAASEGFASALCHNDSTTWGATECPTHQPENLGWKLADCNLLANIRRRFAQHSGNGSYYRFFIKPAGFANRQFFLHQLGQIEIDHIREGRFCNYSHSF